MPEWAFEVRFAGEHIRRGGRSVVVRDVWRYGDWSKYAKGLIEALKTTTEMKTVDFTALCIERWMVEELLAALAQQGELRALFLADNDIDCRKVFAALGGLKNLELLDLSGNKNHEGVGSYLMGLPKLKRLWLQACGCFLPMAELAGYLESTTCTLVQLYLTRTPIADKGAALLGLALQSNTTVRRLDVDDCRIGPRGMRGLIKGLARLEHLDISKNKGRDVGAFLIARMLGENQDMTDLNVQRNGISRKGVAALAAAAAKHPVLRTLHMQGNFFGAETRTCLEAALLFNVHSLVMIFTGRPWDEELMELTERKTERVALFALYSGKVMDWDGNRRVGHRVGEILGLSRHA